MKRRNGMSPQSRLGGGGGNDEHGDDELHGPSGEAERWRGAPFRLRGRDGGIIGPLWQEANAIACRLGEGKPSKQAIQDGSTPICAGPQGASLIR
jgi:hypothetical protein